MNNLDYSKSTYRQWIKEAEQNIDAEMRAYWRLVEINGSCVARHERLKKADRYVRDLELYRAKLYHLEASQGAA